MRNPIFKEKVAALFEKVAFGQDPHAVAVANPNVRGNVNRGLALEKGLHGFAVDADKVLSGAGNLAEKVLTTGASPTGLGARALGGISNWAMAHPTAAIGTATLAPILMGAFNTSRHRYQNELMNAYQDPTRMVTASLDEFLETKAAAFGGSPSPGLGSEVLKAFGGGIGGAVALALANHIGTSFSQARREAYDEPKRKALLESLFRSDPVLHDAIARHPDSKASLLEAYGTMVKFAPTLSLDINAVRSFLRESVLGGAGVNYATIKNLIDTERAAAEAKPRYGGK